MPKPSANLTFRPAGTLSRFAAIARLTALETCRQPVFLLISLAAGLGILLFPLVLNYTLGDTARIVRDSAFSLAFVAGLALAAHSAVTALSHDLRRGPAAVWLSADCSRPLWFAAKCAGVFLALLLYVAAILPATLLAVRACGDGVHTDWPVALTALAAPPVALALAALWNLTTRRPANATAAALLPVVLAAAWLWNAFLRRADFLPNPAAFDWPLCQALLLLTLPLFMTAVLAAALAVRLPPGVSLLLSLLLFGAGLFSAPLLAPRASRSLPAAVLRAVLPDLQAYWLPDALDTPSPFPRGYFPRAAAAAAAWSAAVFTLGALALHRREIPA